MKIDELPLLDLFMELRKAGLPLGVGEYNLLLRALQAGFGLSSRSALARLCCNLWVKSEEQKRLFDERFEQVIKIASGESLASTEPNQSTQQSPDISSTENPTEVEEGEETPRDRPSQSLDNPLAVGEVTVNTESERSAVIDLFADIWEQAKLERDFTEFKKSSIGLDLRQLFNTELEEETATAASTLTALTLDPSSKLALEVEDELQVAKSLLQSTDKDEEIAESAFIWTSEYFPVTKRQMKQCWRFLRRPIREGAPVELDVEATVNRVGREGIMVEPVLVPRRINRSELLLLIDSGGSMVPFHALSRRLAETAVRGGRLGKADIYYFHNCPADYLYPEPNHPAAKPIRDILVAMRDDRAAILIFSDAGAARGGLSRERIELTEEFLLEVRKKVRYIAWLNPMSRQRWQGTSAEKVAQLVPMFEMTRRGLQAAINVLRGRTA